MIALYNVDELLPIIKKRLRVTWEDAVEDENITMMVKAGIKYLDGAAGEPIDYKKDDIAFEMLYVFVLYSRSDSIAEFRRAYAPDLLSLSLRYKANRLKKDVGEIK